LQSTAIQYNNKAEIYLKLPITVLSVVKVIVFMPLFKLITF